MLAWLRAAGGRLRPVGWHPLSLAHASGEGEALALLHLPPAPTKGGRLEVDALPSPQGLVTARGSRADPLGISSSAHKGLTCVFISLDEVPAAVALGLEPAALPGEATVAVLKEPRATSAQVGFPGNRSRSGSGGSGEDDGGLFGSFRRARGRRSVTTVRHGSGRYALRLRLSCCGEATGGAAGAAWTLEQLCAALAANLVERQLARALRPAYSFATALPPPGRAGAAALDDALGALCALAALGAPRASRLHARLAVPRWAFAAFARLVGGWVSELAPVGSVRLLARDRGAVAGAPPRCPPPPPPPQPPPPPPPRPRPPPPPAGRAASVSRPRSGARWEARCPAHPPPSLRRWVSTRLSPVRTRSRRPPPQPSPPSTWRRRRRRWRRKRRRRRMRSCLRRRRTRLPSVLRPRHTSRRRGAPRMARPPSRSSSRPSTPRPPRSTRSFGSTPPRRSAGARRSLTRTTSSAARMARHRKSSRPSLAPSAPTTSSSTPPSPTTKAASRRRSGCRSRRRSRGRRRRRAASEAAAAATAPPSSAQRATPCCPSRRG